MLGYTVMEINNASPPAYCPGAYYNHVYIYV